jgi:serine/threonine protein kinase
MKAANLLISNNGSLRIADFGLARTYDPSAATASLNAGSSRSKERRYTNCVVTRWYRPPELLLGARNYGGEIDIWGVGYVRIHLFLVICLRTYSDVCLERCSCDILSFPEIRIWTNWRRYGKCVVLLTNILGQILIPCRGVRGSSTTTSTRSD